ncbi:DUF2399 domain-containing protein [Streptomyces sp. NPDC006134]|uniref:DUF2399 domain-containing protein n=1 Tax=Streptomyces sp. NPDC006134 TaxID=3154467 RepID=UPI0033F1F6AE
MRASSISEYQRSRARYQLSKPGERIQRDADAALAEADAARAVSNESIHIRENPCVVEAAADAACLRPLVCTSGSAATVVLMPLDALAATGCRFAYHGDFDWPGIVLANRIIRRYGALPWRMGAEDYERLAARSRSEGIPQPPLGGQPVSAAGDPRLSPSMTALGVALHEEAALDLLVDDLSGRSQEGLGTRGGYPGSEPRFWEPPGSRRALRAPPSNPAKRLIARQVIRPIGRSRRTSAAGRAGPTVERPTVVRLFRYCPGWRPSAARTVGGPGLDGRGVRCAERERRSERCTAACPGPSGNFRTESAGHGGNHLVLPPGG